VSEKSLGEEFRKESEDLIATLQELLSQVIRGTDERIALPPGAEAALADFYDRSTG